MLSFKELIVETIHPKDTVVTFPHKGKVTTGKVVRYEKGGPKLAPHYVIHHGTEESAKVPPHKVERVTALDEETAVKASHRGTCVNSFDKGSGECTVSHLPYRDVSHFASAEENAHKVSKQHFLKHAQVPKHLEPLVHKKSTEFLHDKEHGVHMIHDTHKDVHHFFTEVFYPKFKQATKTDVHYTGQINGKTYVVPHSFNADIDKTVPIRHAIVVSPIHVQHNNPSLTPEEVARVHIHIKDIHGGQEPAKLEESMFNSLAFARSKWLQDFHAHAKKQGVSLDHKDIDRAKNFHVSGHSSEEALKKVLERKKSIKEEYEYPDPKPTGFIAKAVAKVRSLSSGGPATRRELKAARGMRPGAADRFLRRYGAAKEEVEQIINEERYFFDLGGNKGGGYVHALSRDEAIKKVTKTHGHAPIHIERAKENFLKLHETIKHGDEVEISHNYGVDSGKQGTVLHPNKVRTNSRGVPTDVPGAYKPVDHKKEHVVKLHNGSYAVVPKGSLTKLKEDTMNEGVGVFHGTATYHQTNIAKKTLRMPDAMVGVAGGPNKEEARAHLKRVGWTDKQIHRHEHGVAVPYPLKERTLTPAEDAKKEDLVHHMKKNIQGFKERYGKDAKSVMYATATKHAKELAEEVTEGQHDERPSQYKYVGKHNTGYHIFQDEEGKKELYHRHPVGQRHQGWGLKHKGRHYEYVRNMEESVQLQELSPMTLKSYIKKAAPSLATHSYMSGAEKIRAEHRKGNRAVLYSKYAASTGAKSEKREAGIVRAVGKLEENVIGQNIDKKTWHLARSLYTAGYGMKHITHHTKLSEKEVHHVLGRPHGVQGPVQVHEAAPFMTTYKRNESANRHTANIVHLAKHFGDKADQEQAKFYADELKKHGHNMHHEAQYELHKKLWPKAVKAHNLTEATGDAMDKSLLVNEELHAYDVHHKGKHIDTVFYGHHEDPESVKKSLVNHDNYHPDITVTKQRRKGNPSFKRMGFGEETSPTLKTVKQVLAEVTTRRHFQQVADILKAIPDAKKRQELANHHAAIFAKDNPRFKHEKFHAAAGTQYTKE